MCFCLNLNILKLKGNHEVNSNSYSNFSSADSLKNALWKAYLNVCSLKELQRLNLFVANSLIKNVTQLCCGRLIKFFSPPTLPVRFTSWCIALSVGMQSWNGLDRHSFCFCCWILKMRYWAVYLCLHQLFQTLLECDVQYSSVEMFKVCRTQQDTTSFSHA